MVTINSTIVVSNVRHRLKCLYCDEKENNDFDLIWFAISSITYKVVVYAPAERADTLLLFLLFPYMYCARTVLKIAFRLSSVAQTVWRIRIRDPLPFWPRDPGWVKKSGSGSGMNNPDHTESLETVFWVKILKILYCGSGIRDGKNSDLGWKNGIQDPQHCAQNRSPYGIPVICRIRKQREHGT